MAGKIIPPVLLFIGTHQKTDAHIIRYLQSVYCQKNHEISCDICTKIENKQYEYLYFINQTETIKIEQIDNLLSTIQYQQEYLHPFFFIVNRVDFLSHACANRLLKILEEMPAGYHFIFTATNESLVQKTIQSRCFKYFVKNDEKNESNIFFCDKKVQSIQEFDQFLAHYNELLLPDHLHFFNQILEYWSSQYQGAATKSEKENAYKKIIYMQTLLSKRIPEGSFTLIARDLYLQWNCY